ncbi:unnamed protein product [Ilex paraguariensis]|uniref:Uncharacterized protein n=1 Tax=Ilex paraguariensis TaxID=185542 RepID=A0ABC8SSS5_9AQUA
MMSLPLVQIEDDVFQQIRTETEKDVVTSLDYTAIVTIYSLFDEDHVIDVIFDITLTTLVQEGE